MKAVVSNDASEIRVIDESGRNFQGALEEIRKWGFSTDNVGKGTIDGEKVYTSNKRDTHVTRDFLNKVAEYKNLYKIEVDDRVEQMAHFVVYGMAKQNGVSTEKMCSYILNDANETQLYSICTTILAGSREYFGY